MPTPDPKFEFPLTIYDRPSIAAANLLSGNLDATTRAIFSPMTLSPNEMKNIRQMFLKDLPDDPVTKTAVDLATNPIVIIGLILMLGSKGAIASSSQLHAMWTGGTAALKGISTFMRPLSSAFTSMRSMWDRGVLRDMVKMVTKRRIFQRDYQHALGRAITKYNADNKAMGLPAMTPKQEVLIGSWMRGFHQAPVGVVNPKTQQVVWGGRGAPFQGYYIKYFGNQAPLMPGLEKAMKVESPNLLPLARRMKELYGRMGRIVLKDASGKIHPELSVKGVTFQGLDYGPSITTRTPFERMMTGTKAMTGKAYKGILRRMDEIGPPARHAKARVGNAIPMQSEMELVKEQFGPGMWDKYTKLTSVQVKNTEEVFLNLATSLKQIKGTFGVDEVGNYVGVGKKKPEIVQQALKEISWQLMDKMNKTQGQRGIAEGVKKITQQIEFAAAHPPEQMKQIISELARGVGAPAEFIMREPIIMNQYINAMAPTYAWFRNSLGPRLQETIHGAWNVKDHKWISQMWDDDLGPMLKGLKNYKEYARSVFFKDSAYNFREWLKSDSPIIKQIPESLRNKMMISLSGARGSLSDATVGGQIASLMYTSALGLNMSPISKNLLQPVITTLPVLGPGNIALGFKRLARDLPKLPSLSRKIGTDRAIRKLFPGYYKYFGGEEITKAMAAGDISKEGELMGKTAASLLRKGQQAIMLPFAGSEKWNRLLTFYSGQGAALADGLSKTNAREFGAMLNMYTNFTGGTLGLAGWARGVWAPFRQFGHFPTRFVEYLYGSMRMGPQGATSTGILGRGMVASAGVYTIAKNLMKMDVSGGLMAQALPGPVYEGSSFYPAPYMPPILGAAGDVLKALHTGKFNRLGSTAALFVPGGIAGRRMWRAWAPKYADYQSRTPDGRIPIYNDDKALITSLTPVQLVMRGMGLHPTGLAAEQQMTKYLLSQRDKIRQYRREYLEALGNNNLEKSQQINKEFQKKYPTLGPLRLKKSDIKAMENRKEVTRLNRVLKGFPKAYQPLFQSLLEQTTLADIAQNIDYNPEMLQSYLPSPVGQRGRGL